MVGKMTMADGWCYHNPVDIIFGSGKLDYLGEINDGSRFLLVTTPGSTRRGVTARIASLIGADRLVIYDNVMPNPELRNVEEATSELLNKGIDTVIALGGGSAIDTGKALAMSLSEMGSSLSLRSHLEHGVPLPDCAVLPLYAIPTTSGTGAEVTPFATIWDAERKKKYSLTGRSVFPDTAILDPLLTIDLPESETIVSGLDALSQGLESVWNRNANPITITLATRAVKLAISALPRLVDEPGDVELRTKMHEASLLSGLAISVTRTALAHSISYPLTARLGIPHGLACSFTLPALFDYNLQADDGRLTTLAKEVGTSGPDEFRDILLNLLRNLKLYDRIGRYSNDLDDLVELAPEMFTPGRADNNMRRIEMGELIELIATAHSDLGVGAEQHAERG